MTNTFMTEIQTCCKKINIRLSRKNSFPTLLRPATASSEDPYLLDSFFFLAALSFSASSTLKKNLYKLTVYR